MEATSLVHFHNSSLLEGLLRPHPTATKRPTQTQATLDVAARNFSPTNLSQHPLSRNTVARSPPHGLKPHSLLISSSQSHSGTQNSKNNNHNLISITNHLRRLIHSRAMPGGEFLYASPSSPPYTTADANNLIQNNNHSPRNLIQNNNHNPNPNATFAEDEAWVWTEIKAEARRDAEAEPALASYLYSTILCHASLERSLSFHLGNKLCSSTLLSTLLYDLFLNALSSDASIRAATVADLRAARLRDPACISFSHCLLNYKGFLACQAHRVAHKLWSEQRRPLALALHSRVSDVFSVDIHPAAKIGKGILFDHATGVVIGETAVIGNNCSILHHVTLGGTGKIGGDRHPKVGDGVLIGAGATILGNVRIGEGAKIGAGSVVLIDVPPRTTAVGNPARLVGGKEKPAQNEDVPGESMDHTSFISEWSDYII